MEKCQRCHKYRWTENCKCEPFHVDFVEWFGDEGKTVHGISFDEVVQTLAEDVIADEPIYDEYIFESDITVTNGHGESKKFNCIASLDVNYSVKER